jgi:hypothetical protein
MRRALRPARKALLLVFVAFFGYGPVEGYKAYQQYRAIDHFLTEHLDAMQKALQKLQARRML